MLDKDFLERLHLIYNRRKYVHPDPLEFLYRYDDPADREIVGLIASSLAYGRVEQILKSVQKALDPLGDSPAGKLHDLTAQGLCRIYRGYKHRFTTGDHLASMLYGTGRVLRNHGSMGALLKKLISPTDITILPAMARFVQEIGCDSSFLLPTPADGSACKRLNLFFRWMVRKDKVDPGGWKGIPRRLLIVPVDTHMANISREFGVSVRKSAGMAMAVEITDYFRKIVPDDPVKYDFVLTRFGIRRDMSRADLHDLFADK